MAGMKNNYTVLYRKGYRLLLAKSLATVAVINILTIEREEFQEDYTVHYVEILEEVAVAGDKLKTIKSMLDKYHFGENAVVPACAEGDCHETVELDQTRAS